MKHKPPVKRLPKGRVSIDVLAVAKAIKAGTLSPEDRATVDRILPNVCAQMETAGTVPGMTVAAATREANKIGKQLRRNLKDYERP